jgi:hypothetical protein
VIEIPGIVHGAVVEVIGGRARRELLQVFLSNDDGACRFALADDMRVRFRNMVGQNLGTDGGADASDGNVVFDANGDAM